MTLYCKENLTAIEAVIKKLSDEDYRHPSAMLSGASIGQHVRHILEFYTCLLEGVKVGVVNYDNRKRDVLLETHVLIAGESICTMNEQLTRCPDDCQLYLEGSYAVGGGITRMPSSYYRELAYCLEHAIHHQALIKIGLKTIERDYLLDDTFGVAPATLRHRKHLVSK